MDMLKSSDLASVVILLRNQIKNIIKSRKLYNCSSIDGLVVKYEAVRLSRFEMETIISYCKPSHHKPEKGCQLADQV
ncbi:Mitochondrial intermediate peptidase [Trichinella pseudospiralis]